VYGLSPTVYPLCLAFLGDVDGEESAFLDELAKRATPGLRALFSCCEQFSADTDLLSWIQERRASSVANYVNCRGRTVRQVHEEAAVRHAVEQHLRSNSDEFQTISARELHGRLREFVRVESSAGRLRLSPPNDTPLGWSIRNFLHLVGVPFLLLLALPLLLLAAPFYIIWLRRLEKTDPEICPSVDQKYGEELSRSEDHDVTNQFSAMGSLKPGIVRLLTTMGVLLTVDYAARHLARPGRLGRIRSIHFARWVFVKGKRRMVFFSNYDGSVESYMDDFINKTGFGLNASFSNGIGYPRVNYLLFGGCADERKYKEFLRRHTLPTQVWYKAYPGLTAIDLERNTLVRKGLESAELSETEARAWAALL
jgi:hypothetical protein